MKKPYQKSYSQCGEDMILAFIFYKALKIKKPTYLDIGAYDPYEDSNTAIFYKNGSKGINVEPSSERYKKIAEKRKRDINLNLGVSNKEGFADFYIVSSEKMSTLVKPKAKKLFVSHKMNIKKSVRIKVTTINKIIEEYCKGICPDLLSLDAEGMDLAILRSINWKRYSPTVICTETASYSTNGNEKKDARLISYLESKGYMVYADTRINTIFIKEDKYINHS
jgi:FkbM family methyltransferase